MKKVLIACFLAFACIAQADAQSAKTAVKETSADPKLILSSKINEFEATLARQRPEASMAVFYDIAALLQERIAAVHASLGEASGVEKEKLSSKLDKQQSIYSDTKMMSTDIAKNGKAMVAKYKEFLASY